MRGCHRNGCGVCRVQGRLLSGDSSVNNSATPLAAPPSLREPRKAMPHCGAGRPGQPSASLAEKRRLDLEPAANRVAGGLFPQCGRAQLVISTLLFPSKSLQLLF